MYLHPRRVAEFLPLGQKLFFQSDGPSIKPAAETIKTHPRSNSPTQTPFSKLLAWHGRDGGGRCGWHGFGTWWVQFSRPQHLTSFSSST